MIGMRYDEIRDQLKRHFADMLRRQKSHLAEHGPLTPDAVAAYRNGRDFAQQGVDGGASIDPTIVGDDGYTGQFIERYSLAIEPGTEQFKVLQNEFKVAYRDYCSAVLAQGELVQAYDYEPANAATSVEAGLVEQHGATISITELSARYFNESKRGDQWVAKTELEKSDHVALLAEVLGADTDIRLVSITDAQRVKETLLRYPKNRNKDPRTRGRALDEVLKIGGVQTLNVQTLNKYLQTIGTMFEWAKRNGLVEYNHFSGLTVRQNKKNTAATRGPFSPEQVQLLLRELVLNPHGYVKREYQKWGPLIGLYTGARLNEIAQLHLSDIRDQDGCLCFDFNDNGEEKHLKSAASRRVVPVHPDLLHLGLSAYVDELRHRGESKLFPSFRYDAKNGWGRSLGRWFNDVLVPNMGMKGQGIVFHSLRHTVVTRLSQADVPQPVVQAIVGHTREGVTQQNYFRQGYTARQLATALSKLPYGLQGEVDAGDPLETSER